WNDTVQALPPVTLHGLIDAQVARTPDAIAVRFEDASLDYAELDARANRLAHHLITLGVRRGALVGVCAERSLELVVALLGVMKAGAAYVPLDPSHPPQRLGYVRRDCGATVLIAQRHLVPKLGATDDVRHLVLLDEAATWGRYPPGAPDVAVGPEDLAY
ncbi:AMP-binding protein, partial [Paraburkholderia sp. A1RI_3L]